MKNYLAFAATNNRESINKQLIKYATTKLDPSSEVNLIDLNDFDCPMFSPALSTKEGLPAKAKEFYDLITKADGIIISFAEYNGSYTPVFKNLMDWASTAEEKLWQHKPMLLMSTSPGGRGGITLLETAANYFPFMDGKVCGTFCLPSFHKNFSDEAITDASLNKELEKAVSSFEQEKVVSVATNQNKTDIFEKLNKLFGYSGYSLLALIVGASFAQAEWFTWPFQAALWATALYAACFTLVIRPIYEFIPHPLIEKMLVWRKGIGLISSSIVLGFWASKWLVPMDISYLATYFTSQYWGLDIRQALPRISEITAFILFFASNKWLVKNFNTAWRWSQKTAYPYFLSAAFYVYLVVDKTYALVLLIIFFAVYVPFCIKLWFFKGDKSSASRKTQAS